MLIVKLTTEQRNNLLALIGEANIKGSAWRVIAELENALKNAVLDTPPTQIVTKEEESLDGNKSSQ